MAIPSIPPVSSVIIGRKVEPVAKVADTIRRTWPAMSNVASQSIAAVVRILKRMSALLGEEQSSSAIWNAARCAIDEAIKRNPYFGELKIGSGISKQSAINFFAKLYELLL